MVRRPIGKVRELGTIEKQKDAEEGIEQKMYENTVDFVHHIIRSNSKTNISAANYLPGLHWKKVPATPKRFHYSISIKG